MTTEAQETVPNDLEKFASHALRRTRPGSYEHLLCQHLIRSVASEPLEKIRLVSEAAYMVPDTPVDRDTLEALYNVVTSLIRSRQDIVNPYKTGDWHSTITWGFQRTKKNFEKYINPWMKSWDGIAWIRFDTKEKSEWFINLEWGATKFYKGTSRIYISGLAIIESRFITWAIPQIMTMFEQLSKLVNPDLYDSMLEKMRV
jgi:hypothetical protein